MNWHSNEHNLTHHFLIGTPDNAQFSDCVVFICSNEETGSFGFIINRASSIDVASLLNANPFDFPTYTRPILFGGVVEQTKLMLLYRNTDESDNEPAAKNSIESALAGSLEKPISAGGGVFVSSFNPKLLRTLIEQNHRYHYLALLGFMYWPGGTLKSEIACNQWFVTSYDENILFHLEPMKRYPAALKRLNLMPHQLVKSSAHA